MKCWSLRKDLVEDNDVQIFDAERVCFGKRVAFGEMISR